MIKPFASSAMLAACLCLLVPRAGSAQAAPYMTALVMPPSTVGTCVQDERSSASPRPGRVDLRTSHLLMKTRSPGGERDITVYVDDAGVLRGYSELVIRQTAMTSSERDRVMAMFVSNGGVHGTITHGSVTMPQPDLRSGVRPDSAMRAMRAHAKHTATSASLSADDAAKVHAIADWLVQRCPPR